MKNFNTNTIPHTYAKATVTKLKKVQGVFALEVKNTMYRGAKLMVYLNL